MNALTLSGTSGDRRDGCVGSRFTLAVGSDKGRAGIGRVAGLISASDGAFRLLARLLRLVVRRMLSHGRRSTWHAVTLVPSARRRHSTCASIGAPARPLPAGEQTKLRGSGGLLRLLGRTSSARVGKVGPAGRASSATGTRTIPAVSVDDVFQGGVTEHQVAPRSSPCSVLLDVLARRGGRLGPCSHHRAAACALGCE